MKALKKIRKSEGELDAEVWSKKLEEKWQKAMDTFERAVRRKEAKEEVRRIRREEKERKVGRRKPLVNAELNKSITQLILIFYRAGRYVVDA